jgi:hypothetical protein
VSQPVQLDEAERTEILALYQVTTQDLVFFKSQQWTLLNYGLVALAAVAAVPQITGLNPTAIGRWVLMAAAALVTVATAWLLWRLHGSIEERRARLQRVYTRLSDEFRLARGVKTSVNPWEMLIPLHVLLAIACGFSLWVTWRAT